MRNSQYGQGKWIRTQQHNKANSESRKGTYKGEGNHFFGKKHSKMTKVLMRLHHKGMTGRHHSEESKAKQKIAISEYIKRIGGIFGIGQNEREILDELEQKLDYKIIRQYRVGVYRIDGYIPELNLAIEVDEIPKIKDKDINRQRIIEEKLNCKFIRIEDYD
jgi:hypothetical protein